MSVHCRTCGEPIYNLNPRNLFSHENKDIRKNIEAITGIKLSYHSHLPSHVCSCCYLDLNHSMAFRQRCVVTHKHFMSLKQSDFAENNLISKQSLLAIDPLFDYDLSTEEDAIIESKYTTDYPPTTNVSMSHKKLVQNTQSHLSPRVRIMRCRHPSEALEKPIRPTTNPAAPSIISRSTRKVIRKLPDEMRNVKKNKPRIAPLEKKFVCDQCGWSFRDLSNMKDHAVRHSGVKNFECEECGCKFFTRPLLMLHVRVHHKGEKPFVCKYCGMAFRNSPSRCRHERCETCKKTFKGAIFLKNHYTTKFHQRRVNEMIKYDLETADITTVTDGDVNFDFSDSIIEEIEN
ncbi:GH22313 [Drosophila grimshawi]|uniref:GH22313 n=1 Tax=Drosophila grimshawi TaxID=7222 RepID=B4JYX4_DROGR|nr:GH22313 [Drosophila grimshawi]